jgi:hypothetical protein
MTGSKALSFPFATCVEGAWAQWESVGCAVMGQDMDSHPRTEFTEAKECIGKTGDSGTTKRQSEVESRRSWHYDS